MTIARRGLSGLPRVARPADKVDPNQRSERLDPSGGPSSPVSSSAAEVLAEDRSSALNSGILRRCQPHTRVGRGRVTEMGAPLR